MPDTYTKEQIAEAKEHFETLAPIVRSDGYTPVPPYGMILISALSTAEQERDRLQNDLADALDCKRGEGPTALSMVIAECDALKARCAELEARLQGAAERGVEWQEKLCKADEWSCKDCAECAELRSAIVGEKGIESVTHWMPLPEPPVGKEGEE